MAGRSSSPTTGCATAIPGRSRRPQEDVEVGFGGHTRSWTDSFGDYKVQWIPDTIVKGIPYDTPILGYRSGIANTLRLWRSEATESFYFERFNSGDYQGAVGAKVFAENISKVLISQRRRDPRQAAAPGAAVLLHLLLAART